MENLQIKDVVTQLVSNGVDYFTIAKALNLQCKDLEDNLGVIDIGILPTDLIVIDRARRLIVAGFDFEIISQATGISIQNLKNLEFANLQVEHLDTLLTKRLVELGLNFEEFSDCLVTKSRFTKRYDFI